MSMSGAGAAPGVTIVEAVISLTVITIMVGVLLSSQGYGLRQGVSTMSEQEIVQALQRRFVEIDKDHLDARKKVIQSELKLPLLQGTIEYSSRKPSADSALYRMKNIFIETLTARWVDHGREARTQLTRLRTYPAEDSHASQ